MPFDPDAQARAAAAHRRLRGFGLHLIAYFGVMIILVAANFMLTPEDPWFVVPMVGWGAALGVHAAFAMGLFKIFR